MPIGARLLMQGAVEVWVTEFLGRDRCQRTAARCQPSPSAYASGLCPAAGLKGKPKLRLP